MKQETPNAKRVRSQDQIRRAKMKVKIFGERDKPWNEYGFCKVYLEKRVNDFIKDKKVIDIKYQANISGYASESFHDVDMIERALVMYEEK